MELWKWDALGEITCIPSKVLQLLGAAVVASSDDKLNLTKLWHMQLGHAGEKSLQKEDC